MSCPVIGTAGRKQLFFQFSNYLPLKSDYRKCKRLAAVRFAAARARFVYRVSKYLSVLFFGIFISPAPVLMGVAVFISSSTASYYWIPMQQPQPRKLLRFWESTYKCKRIVFCMRACDIRPTLPHVWIIYKRYAITGTNFWFAFHPPHCCLTRVYVFSERKKLIFIVWLK